MASGPSPSSPRPAFRACSTCDITATRDTFLCGHSPDTARFSQRQRSLEAVNAFERGAVLAVTGLAMEARIARGPGVRCVTGRDGLRGLVSVLSDRANGVCAMMSFGIAGGLDEHLPPGTVIAARSVITQQGSWKTNADWT